METEKIYWEDLGVEAQISLFSPTNGVGEFHSILHVDPRCENFDNQLTRIYAGEDRLAKLPKLSGAKSLVKRYFLSDSTNQRPLMKEELNCANSFIQQSPLDGSKIGVWIYMVKGCNVYNDTEMMVSEHNGYRHLWKMCMYENKKDSQWQTDSLLNNYEKHLQQFGANIADNCIRTWFFVRDVDTNYTGMVKARRDFFKEHGLTPETHYIASTGIGGLPAETHAIVQFDTYAITGLDSGQQKFLYASSHLNPTYEYGVTFERGTSIEYGDRKHVYISGTASINNKGEVMHVGNIEKQTLRMWENVETLLTEAGTTYDDLMQIVVYLRDLADYDVVSKMFKKKFPHTPYIITLAPVCRPTWLIEMECVAVKQNCNKKFRDF